VHIGEVELAVGVADLRVDKPTTVDYVASPQIAVRQRRSGPAGQQRRQWAIAGTIEASAEIVRNPRVAQVDPDPPFRVEGRPLREPAVLLDEPSASVVPVPAIGRPSCAMHPGHAATELWPVR